MIHGKTVARYSHPDFDVTRHTQGDGCIGWLEELCDVCAVLVTSGTHANRIVRPIVRETNEVKKGARPSFSTHQEESNKLLFGPLRVRGGRKVTRGRSSDLRTEHTCRLVDGVGGPWVVGPHFSQKFSAKKFSAKKMFVGVSGKVYR